MPATVGPAIHRSCPPRVIAILAFVSIVVFIDGCSRPRTIVVTCRNMAFLLAGNPSPNPVITVRAGETIALEVRNEDGPGILHDLAIDPLGVSTELLLPGQAAHATFTAPDHPGRFDYYCRPHALIMRGTLDVVAP